MKTNFTPDRLEGALPKLCGADIELGNFIAGVDRAGGTGFEASRALIAEIEGLPRLQNNLYGWGQRRSRTRSGSRRAWVRSAHTFPRAGTPTIPRM